jgi:hypothetical protein
MTVSRRVTQPRSPMQIWKVSVAILLPVLLLMGLAARAATSIERPASDVSTSSGR